MTPYEMEKLAAASAYELGWAVGAIKRAAEANDPNMMHAVEQALTPAHRELLENFREAGGQLATGK